MARPRQPWKGPELFRGASPEEHLFKYYLDEQHHAKKRKPHPTQVTKAVKKFAASSSFKPQSSDIEHQAAAVRKIVERISGFYKHEPSEVREPGYDMQTAHDVVTHEAIPSLFIKVKGTRDRYEPVWGCKVGCDALVAVLKARGAEDISYIRTQTDTGMPHSLVMFKLPGMLRGQTIRRTYLADPFPAAPLMEGDLMVDQKTGRQSKMVQVGQMVRGEIEARKHRGAWKEGESSRDLKITFKGYYENGE